MEQMLTLIVENGVSLGSFIALLYFIFTDKKQTNELLNKITSTLDNIEKNMVITNERLSQLEKEKGK